MQQKQNSGKKKFRATLAFFAATFLALVAIIYQQCEQLALAEAEKNLASFLLNHRAIHSFVEEVQKPEIYGLKEKKTAP